MKLTLGFSPCPNDTFIFDALIHHKIDTEGLDFDVHFDDVETLNQKAFGGELDITKLSFHAFGYATGAYRLLDSGSALGFGVGPLLIAHKRELAARVLNREASAKTLRVGIPGKYTTANFLLGLAFPELSRKEELVFSEIEDALLNNHIDLGLIIHENRFTYHEKGLEKVIDLGDYWEKETGCAIPLGGIVIRRSLGTDLAKKVNRLLRKSVEYALANPASAISFIREHAQEMEEEVMYKHIELYVNRFSVDLGPEGRGAVQLLFDKAAANGIIPRIEKQLFLPT
jgi:1,4-dihydroxy-6-naphthoate synthase